jgi:diguanylate cyclase (GGDEF)-like protein
MSSIRLSPGASRSRLLGHAVRGVAALKGLRPTILLVCLAISLPGAALGVHAALAIMRMRGLAASTFADALACLNAARAARADFAAIEDALQRRPDDPPRPAAAPADVAALRMALTADIATLVARSTAAAAPGDAAATQAAVARWTALAETAARSPPPGSDSVVDSTRRQAAAQLEQLIGEVLAAMLHRRDLALAGAGALLGLALAGAALGMLFAAAAAWGLSRHIRAPLLTATAAARRMAGGDLDVAIPPGGDDEPGHLLTALAVLRDSTRERLEWEQERRHAAETRLLDTAEGSGEGVLLVGADARIALANTQAVGMLNLLRDHLQPGMAFAGLREAAIGRDLFAPDGTPGGDPASWLADDWSGECETPLADGRWLRVARSIASDGGFIVILSDITALKSYQSALEEANRRFAAALNNMSQGLILFDAQDRLQVCNERYREIFRLPAGAPAMGISQQALVELRVAYSPDGRRGTATLAAERATVIARGEPTAFFEEMADGRTIAVKHVPIEQGGWVATFDDVTEQHRSLAQIHYLARHDELTSLCNRMMFTEQLTRALEDLPDDAHVALLHLDLDHFKQVNDTLGHGVGDEVLRGVARRLLECRGLAEAVARLGADEFAIIMADIPKPELAADMALWLLDAFGESFEVDGHEIPLGLSIGIAVAPGDGTTAELLAEHAERAMDRAKADERGTYRFFEPAMNDRLQLRRSLEIDLRRAVSQGQLEVFFQPLVDLNLKRISGFEALLRWRHPQRGLVSPGEFIPLAEETGLILSIGEWVLHHACAVAATWPAGLKVAVNISPIQFRNQLLVHTVGGALAASGLPAGRLELEITESALLAATAPTLEILRNIKRLGTRIAMDDFGTGYSSLSYLRSFPFDKLKIDKSFIDDLRGGNNAGAIIEAIVAMARTLGMRTTAEGVETVEQLELLQAAGCHEVQGYLFGRPGPAQGIPELLAAELAAAV